MKRCGKCGRELPESEFYRKEKSPDGLQAYCKSCQTLNNRKKQNNQKPRAMSNKKQFQKWFTYFDFIPPCPGSKGQWQVKEDTDAQTPICAVPDPIGGERDSDGLNPRQRANARLIAAAPELLEW